MEGLRVRRLADIQSDILCSARRKESMEEVKSEGKKDMKS